MPRGKGFRKSQAAKRRNAERYLLGSSIDLTDEVMPPHEKKALTDGVKPPPEQKVQNDVTDKRVAPYLKRRDEVLSPLKKKANEQSTNKKTDATISGTTICDTKNCNTKNAETPTKSSPRNHSENHSEKILIKTGKIWNDVSTCLHVSNSDHFPQKVLQGSFHQGDEQFGFNRNRQCAVNSITAVMMSVLKDVLTWTTEDLNAVLMHGDELYTSMRLQGNINDPTQRGYVFLSLNAQGIPFEVTAVKATVTETWLNVDDPEPEIPGFVFKHNPRAKCYDNSTALYTELKHQRGGGVGVYCSEKSECNMFTPELWNLECLYFVVPHVNLTAALLYRPNSYKTDLFRQQLLHIIDEMEKHPGQKIIMGDFNEDIFTSSTIVKLMEQHGYNQHVKNPTTEKGTLIDHVYTKDMEGVDVAQTYYSFHQAILILML